jgi:serine O-acetyltransferase
MVEYLIRILFSSDISCRARIPGNTVFVHGHDIVIGSNVIMGDNCKIFNGVTLGSKNTESWMNSSEGAIDQPSIGNRCVISTGAKILGNIRIGDDCIIGANAVVISNIPSNSIAVGVPAKIIKRKQ